MSRTAWLGFLFFCALVILGFGTLTVGGIGDLLGGGASMSVHFERVEGLREGDDVRVDGVLFGKVAGIALNPSSGVNVALRLDRPIQLGSDATIAIDSSSVLGGNYVAIKRGSKEPFLDTGTLLPGRVKPGLDEFSELAAENRANFKDLISNLKDVTQALKDGRGSIGKALTQPELHDEVVATVKEAKSTVAEFKKTAETATAEIKKLGDKIDKGAGPVPALLNDKAMTDRLRSTLDEIDATAKHLNSIARKIDTGEGPLGKLVNDKPMGESLKRAVENVEKSAESLQSITGKIASGEGTIGRLVQDDELYEKARQTLEDVDNTLGRAARAKVEVVGESRYYEDSSVQISKLGVRITPSEDKWIFAGVAALTLDPDGGVVFENLLESGEGDTEFKPEVLLGYRVPFVPDGRLTFFGGLFEGKGGGGLTFTWDEWLLFTHPITFAAEIRDSYNDLDDEDIDEQIDGPLIRALAKTPFWTRRANWFEELLSYGRFYAGVSRVGEDPEFFIGAGLEFEDRDIRTLIALIGIAQ